MVESPKSRCWVGTSDLGKVQGPQRRSQPVFTLIREDFRKGIKEFLFQTQAVSFRL